MPYRRAYIDQMPAADRWLLKVGAYAGLILGLSAIAMIWIAPFYFAARSHEVAERSAYQDSANLALAFEEQLLRSIEAVDQTLIYAREKYQEMPWFNLGEWWKSRTFLAGLSFQVAIVGRDGHMVASSIPGALTGIDVSDREHFQVHVSRTEDELFISKPVLGRLSNTWSIQLTRRMSGADGSFAGVVVASVNPEYLGRFYQSIDVGEFGSVTVIGTDGVVRARGHSTNNGIGQSLVGGKVFEFLKTADAGNFEAKSVIDGVDRFYSYRKVKGYPLVVVVGQSKVETFASALSNKREALYLAVALTIWLGGITYLLWRYERALSRSRDAAEAGTRARTEFLAMMSHEIRTPMNGVVGMLEVLMQTGLSAKQRDYMRALRSSAEHLLRVINDVLDFAKLEAHRLQIDAVAFDVRDVVQSTIEALRPGAAEKGLTLNAEIAADVPRSIVSDPSRLRQILFNLVGNGIKFTESGDVTVSVRHSGEKMLPGHVRLDFSVSDTGIGIPADGIPLLFKEFSQLDSSIARRFGGTGLGLAICRRLVTLMDGSIEVQSEVGKGTTIRFMIDARIGGEADAPGGTKAPAAVMLSRDLRILLAEDNKTNRQVFIAMIEGLGLSADIAHDGAEALAACERKGYDVVFMDVMMPGMDGLAATRAIRRLSPPRGAVPIVALTANASAVDREMCLEAGMNDFLAKPVRRAELIDKLQRLGTAQVPAAEERRPAAVETPDEPEMFDKTIFGELREAIGDEGVAAVLRIFLAETPERLATLQRAAGEGRHDIVRVEAHTIKSAAASIGFMQLSHCARVLEKDAGALSATGLHRRSSEIAAAFAAIAVVAHAELGALNARSPVQDDLMKGTANA